MGNTQTRWAFVALNKNVFTFQRPYKIVISNHTEQIFSPKCRINATFADSGKFNLYVEFLNIIRNPFMHTALYFESENGKYDMEVLNRTVDLCKFYKNKRYEPILQVIFKLFADYLVHWARGCPMHKVRNLRIKIVKVDWEEEFFAGCVLSQGCGIECRKAATNIPGKEWSVRCNHFG